MHSTNKPALTVADLLAEKDFGLELVAGAGSTDRPIEGIHLSELEDPTPWMLPHSILLATGVNIEPDPAAGARLVEVLAAANMSALGIALDHYLPVLPTTMVRRAEDLGFPLFTAPMTIPFRRITAFVYNALASQDMYRLRRSLSVQSHLLELLIEERGMADLVADLSRLLETTVLLFDGRGTILAETQGHPRLSSRTRAGLWRSYLEHRGRREPLPAFQSGGFRVSYREVTLYGRAERVLMAAYANRPIPELAETTLSFAQKLLTLDRLRERDVATLQRRMRSGLMDDLVSGIGTERELAERMRQYGLDPTRPWRVAVYDVDGFSDHFQKTPARQGQREEQIQAFKSAFLDSTEAFLASQGLPYLTVLKGDSVAALIQFADPGQAGSERTLAALRERLEADLAPVTLSVGVSAPATGASAAVVAFKQAREALALASQGGAVRIRFFDQIHPQNRLLEGQSDETLAAIYEETLGPLLEYDAIHRARLVHTLQVYMGEDRSIARAAHALYMHRNTLTKRLARIEQLLGRSLSATDDLVAIDLGLKAAELLSGKERTP
ncbi:MAG: PucR family transcriptional regulator ligand-binding domain-containing protein [Actinobacteria bacterium]|nr:PucR family transcriptional regulator ligand-binding domain-containing protein [Actinomycetota bacterium]